MALTQLTKVDGGGISTTSDYRVGIITASKFVGPFDGTAGNFSGVVTATSANFTGNVTIGGTLTYEDVTNIDSVGIITAQKDIHVGAGVSVVGIVTAATFKGDGDFVDIDVDGHTNLDNVTVTGISTLGVSGISNPNLTDWATKSMINLYGSYGGGISFNDNGNNGFQLYTTSAGVNFHIKNAAVGGTPKSSIKCIKDGAVELYHNGSKKIETYNNGVQLTGNVYIPDGSNSGSYLGLGNAADLRIYHDGSLNVIDATAHNLEIRHGSEKMIVAVPDGAVELYHDNNKIFNTMNTGVEIYGAATQGAIYLNNRSGTQTGIINANDSGQFFLQHGNNEIILKSTENSAVELYHNNIKRLETSSVGVSIPQDLDVDGHTNLDNVNIAGVTTTTDNIIINADNKILKIGASEDIQIFHQGGTSIIKDINDNPINIQSDGEIKLAKDGNAETYARFIPDGAVELYYNGTKQFETGSSGVLLPDMSTNKGRLAFGDFGTRIEGGGGGGADDGLYFMTNSVMKWQMNPDGDLIPSTAGAVDIGSASKEIGDVYLADSKRLYLGSDQDLHVFHDNTHGYISNRKNNIYLSAPNYVMITSTDTNGSNQQTSARFLRAGSSEIYYSNSLKFETSSTGITVTGEVASSQDYPDFRPALDLNFVQNQTLDPRITYSRVGSASFTDENGRLKFVGSHVPRLDHEPGTGKPRGLLIEAAGTNIMKSYGYFNNQNVPYGTYFSNTNGASGELSTDILAPDGSNVTFKMHWPNGYSATANGYARIGNSSGDVGQLTAGDYAFSYFVKRGTDGAHNMDGLLVNEGGVGGLSFTAQQFTPYYAPSVSIRTDTNSDIIVEKYPDGWYRISNILFNATQTWTPHNTGVSHYVLAGSNYKTYYEAMPFYYWGMQLEKNPVSTSYIGATVKEQTTRAADSAVIDGENFNEFFNHNGAETNNYQGTLIASMESAAASSPSSGRFNKIQLEVDNGNKVQLSTVGGGSPYVDSVISYGTATQIDSTGSQGSTFPTSLKHGIAFAKNNLAYCYNGNTVETDGSANVGGSAASNKYTQLTLGGAPTKAHIRRVMYYSQRISNTQLRNLTS